MSYNKENRKYHALLFFFTPVLGLIYGFKSGSLKLIRWNIFIFTVIFGSLLSIEYMGDGARHWQAVYDHYQYLNFDVWWDELIAILNFSPMSTTNDDVYIHVISYVIGSIFNAPGLFFVVVAIVYGYFYSGALYRISRIINWNLNLNRFYLFYFLIFLILFKSPMSMQTVRSWTGMWVLVYAILSYHETKKIKYLFLAFIPPLIHVGYFAICIPFWLVLLSGFRNPKLYFIIFILSMFFSNVIGEQNIMDVASQTEVGKSKAESYYMTDARIESREENLQASQANFYKKYEQNRIHYNVFSGLIIFIFVVLSNYGFSKIENTIFSYSLAGASFANFFTMIFALYSRTWQVSGIFILTLMVIFLSKNNLKDINFNFIRVKAPLFLFSLALFPYLLFLTSNLINYCSAYVFLLPLGQWIIPNAFVSIKQLIVFFL